MKKLIITLGQDLSAYATIEVSAETDLSDETLAAIARKAVEDDGTVFDEDWSTVNALRVVLVQDDRGNIIRSDVPVESSCYEGGVALQSYLKGAIGFDALVNSALQAKLIEPSEQVAMAGRRTTAEGAETASIPPAVQGCGDAALPAAAADLLAMLEACEAVLAGEGGHEGGLFLEEVRAVIAKAKGQSS
ncbi:MAG: hypothetical protein ACOZCP_07975 [Pseudomonadota bacterium]